MNARTLVKSLTMFAVLTMLLACVPVAMAGMDKAGDYKEKYGGEKYGEKGAESGKMIKGVYLVVSRPDQPQMDNQTRDGMAGKIHQFGITGMAIKGEEGKAAVFNFDKPLKGVYDVSDDMAYISTANFLPSNVKMGQADDLSLSVSGASSVIKMEDVKTLYKGDDYSLMKFGEIYVTAPDGQTTELELRKPVTIVYSKDRNLAVIDAYPTFTESVMNVFAGKEQKTFTSDTMSLKDLSQKEEMATEKSVTYEKPATVKSPAREITQKE